MHDPHELHESPASPPGAPPAGRDPLRSLARWISIVGHPFVLILLYVLVGVATRLAFGNALVAVAIVFFVGVLPMTAYLARLARSGSTNFDVSHREQRGPVYGLGLLLGLGLLAIFWWLDGPPDLLVGVADALLLVVVAFLINLGLKISLHSAFVAWVAVGLWPISPWASLGLACLAVALVWSRLYLDRHTRGEVLAGLALGILMALPLLFVGSSS